MLELYLIMLGKFFSTGMKMLVQPAFRPMMQIPKQSISIMRMYIMLIQRGSSYFDAIRGRPSQHSDSEFVVIFGEVREGSLDEG